MKKVVVLILILLPIFLMITISFAGRIFSVISFIDVESVSIVNQDEEEITETLKIRLNVPVVIKAKILPERATNKRSTFRIIPSGRCAFNENGELVGLEFGYATIVVETENMKKTNQIQVYVTEESVSSVNLNLSELALNVKERYTLTATILPISAINKNVTWHSSNPEQVEVNQGVLYAKAQTLPNEPVMITVRTEDGNFEDSCLVTVTNNKPVIAFVDPADGSATYKLQSATIDLMSIIEHNESVNANDIVFEITSGGSHASISNNILAVSSLDRIIKVKAYVSGVEQHYSMMEFVRLN